MAGSWYVPLISVSGAVIVAFLNNWLVRFRDRSDHLSKLVDKICDELSNIADYGSDYWLRDRTDGDGTPIQEIVEMECKLIGKQTRLNNLMKTLESQDGTIGLTEVKADFDILITKLTGGQFKVKDRTSDPEAAALIQHTAASMNGRLRRALTERRKKFF